MRWLAGLAGVAGVLGLLRRRGARMSDRVEERPAPDPAAELRRKLVEARGAEGPPAATAAGPPPPGAPAVDESGPGEVAASLEDRRARLHAKAQEAIESMRTER